MGAGIKYTRVQLLQGGWVGRSRATFSYVMQEGYIGTPSITKLARACRGGSACDRAQCKWAWQPPAGTGPSGPRTKRTRTRAMPRPPKGGRGFDDSR
jgi:hypothetical protein